MTYYEDPSGHFRNVAVHIEPKVEQRYAETEAEEIEKTLDAAIGRGAIIDRFDWRNRLRAEPELVREVLESLPGDREYADKAALRDPRLGNLRRAWDSYVGVEEEPRAYDDVLAAGLPESERQYREFAAMTNERLAR